MPLTVKEIADLKKKLINDQADDYPGLKSMVAAGKLSYKARWYEAKSKEAYDAIIKYASSIRVSKDGKAVQPCTGLHLKVYAAATFALTHE